MQNTTTEIPTHLIVQTPLEGDVTGAWAMEDEVDDTPLVVQSFETIEHPLAQSRRHRLGHAIYWLTHRGYRREVRGRASDIVKDISKVGTNEKQVLPPRSRDFKSIAERRLNTADFALDIKQYIQTVRLMRRLIGATSLMLTDNLPMISPITVPVSETPNKHIPSSVTVVEDQLPSLDGDAPNDGDFIPKIVVDNPN